MTRRPAVFVNCIIKTVADRQKVCKRLLLCKQQSGLQEQGQKIFCPCSGFIRQFALLSTGNENPSCAAILIALLKE